MRTMVVDVSPPKILLTRILGRINPSAYYWPTSPLKLAAIPDPKLPADDWVRVRNRLCGICGSDLHQLFVDAALDVAPVALPSHQRIYLGHEMVGEIVECGPAVKGFATGDRVVRWGRGDDCLARGRDELCPACQRGHRVLCEYASEPREYHLIGGGFSDTFIAPSAVLVLVPATLSDEQAIFTEPAAVAIHAAFRQRVNPGDKALIIGCGTIGYLLMQVLRYLEPGVEMTAVAQFPWQAPLAREFGADHVFMAGDDGYTESAHLTGGRLYQGRLGNRMLMGGFDLVYDVVGQTNTLNNALRWTRAGGTVVLVGVNLHRMKLDLSPIWYQEVDLIGAVGHDVVEWQGEELSTFELAMCWMLAGVLRTAPLLTHCYPLAKYREAFERAVDKGETRSIKVAFDLRDGV